MGKLDYTIEDFVLDASFRKWILSPDESTKKYWEDYLKKHPSKYQDILLARVLLLNMARAAYSVSESRIESTWENIDREVQKLDNNALQGKVLPISAISTIKRHGHQGNAYQFYRMAGILVFGLALLIVFKILKSDHEVKEVPALYEEHYAPPGVKSNLMLQDGSKVILNAGSFIRYKKNFDSDKRELELVGEAYFEVAKDRLRPFIVKTGIITTQVLGTSFNIKAYPEGEMKIALLTGSVEINMDLDHSEKIHLVPGEAVKIDLEKQEFLKTDFISEDLIGWTYNTIVFKQATMYEIIRILENWYGVNINLINNPHQDLFISGRFQEQTLGNVLEGLSYSARFKYEINRDQVTITFEN